MSQEVPPHIFDRELLAKRRERAARHWPSATNCDFLLSRTVDDMIDRLDAIKRSFETVAVVGSHNGALARALRARGRHETILDLDHARGALAHSSGWRAQIDEEMLPLKSGAFDAILSPLSLHMVNDLPGTLVQMRQALKGDGLLLSALLGGETLMELRQAMLAAEIECDGGGSPRVAPCADGRELASLLQRAGFALPVVDSDRLTVAYPNALALMSDLRAMGATNVLADRRRTPLARTTLMRAAAIYAERFARADGKVLATFELITLTAWAPHASQPKPLAPGSAKSRLADALGAREVPTGEKPQR